MAKREITIFDLLPPEAFIQIDELGYNFLAENGYNTEGCMDSNKRRIELRGELKARGEELRYSGAFDKDTKAILVWFELYKKNEKVATSQGLKFLPKPSEGGESGENEENRENQDRPSEAPEDNA